MDEFYLKFAKLYDSVLKSTMTRCHNYDGDLLCYSAFYPICLLTKIRRLVISRLLNHVDNSIGDEIVHTVNLEGAKIRNISYSGCNYNNECLLTCWSVSNYEPSFRDIFSPFTLDDTCRIYTIRSIETYAGVDTNAGEFTFSEYSCQGDKLRDISIYIDDYQSTTHPEIPGQLASELSISDMSGRQLAPYILSDFGMLDDEIRCDCFFIISKKAYAVKKALEENVYVPSEYSMMALIVQNCKSSLLLGVDYSTEILEDEAALCYIQTISSDYNYNKLNAVAWTNSFEFTLYMYCIQQLYSYLFERNEEKEVS